MIATRRGVFSLLPAVTAVLALACSDRTRVATDEDPARLREPAMPTKAPTGTQTQVPNIPANVPADVQQLPVAIRNGEFDKESYVVQAGAVQLRVSAGPGGPFTMRIDDLMQARVIRENDTTVLGLTALPGRYTMKVNAGVEDSAVLEVRPPGGVPGTTPR